MGFWSRWVFPRLCHRTLKGGAFRDLRRELLSAAEGRVLELGSGTGLNFPLYPPAVGHVDALDPNPGMHELARRGLEEGDELDHRVELHEGRGEELPFAEGVFDTVVATWTLCSVGEPARALAEAHRVLVPGGRLLLLEHGASHEPKVARWQERLTPIQRRVADGCHLDRDFSALLTASPLEIRDEERFYLEGAPKIAGYHYRIQAIRP